jgi:hypothetical protein
MKPITEKAEQVSNQDEKHLKQNIKINNKLKRKRNLEKNITQLKKHKLMDISKEITKENVSLNAKHPKGKKKENVIVQADYLTSQIILNTNQIRNPSSLSSSKQKKKKKKSSNNNNSNNANIELENLYSELGI